MRGGSRPGAGQPQKLYKCFDEAITAREAAARLSVSLPTIRWRLQQCGGNMEEVFNFYSRREEEKMEKTKEQIAAEKIANMLFDADKSKQVHPQEEPETEVLRKAAADKPMPQTERGEVGDAKALRVYNRAIRALGALAMVKMNDRGLAERVKDLMQDLIGERCAVFEHLIDWEDIEHQLNGSAQGVKK